MPLENLDSMSINIHNPGRVATQKTCIITARKRSLGQGNIFTPVCHSVHGGGGGVACSQGVCSGGGGAGACSGGVPTPGGVCSWGVPGGDDPPWTTTMWAVHILLECNLVISCVA